MTEKIYIAGQRGGKSFQVGYDAGYAKCKQDIANEPPTTDEVKWVRKLRLAILRGDIELRIEGVNPVNKAALETYVQRLAVDYAEEQTAQYIKALQDENSYLHSQSRVQQEQENPNPLQRSFAFACRILADILGICPQNVFETGWEECMGEADQCGDHAIWKCWQKYINETAEAERVCRVCGCTEYNACLGENLSGCHWVEEDLCSECVPDPKADAAESQDDGA